jgi:hypothetical protein
MRKQNASPFTKRTEANPNTWQKGLVKLGSGIMRLNHVLVPATLKIQISEKNDLQH